MYDISIPALSIHLNQKTAGCFEYKNARFKFDNGHQWPEIELHPRLVGRLGLIYKVTAKGPNGEQWLFSSLPEAARILNLDLIEIKNYRARHGNYQTKNGDWTFSIDKENSLKPRKNEVEVIDRMTGERRVYRTSMVCARELKIQHFILNNHLNSKLAGMLPWNGFYIKYADGREFPDIEYIRHDVSVIGRTINFVVFNDNGGTPKLVTNLTDLCKLLDWNATEFSAFRKYSNRETKFKGLTILSIDDFNIENMINE